MNNKIKSQEEITNIAEQLRKQNKIIVTTNGSFDILHSAHINLLQKAKEQGDVLIVLLNSDSSIKINKGPSRPIIPQNERALMLSALEAVNYITIFNEETPMVLLEKIKPHKHAKGGSVIQERIAKEKELLSKWKGEFISLPLEEGFSTTNIIQKVLDLHK
jgi:D-beta-D-heptose 7-phosphate kinase/D-beta-D-heptose 1-phosphate adenosyltransferase